MNQIFLSLFGISMIFSAILRSAWMAAGLTLMLTGGMLLRSKFEKHPEQRTALLDGAALIVLALLGWQLLSDNFRVPDPVLFPPPEKVFRLFVSELPELLKGLRASLFLLGSGYCLALSSGIVLGLVIGYSRRFQLASAPFIKVLGAIPPIVYIPYAIALLPSFSAASIFVIFIGAFWPVLVNTASGVLQIPSGLIDSARMLHLKKRTFFFGIILRGAMPSICTGASLGLVFSFLLLTAAELIGATEGLGWYVKNFSDFADYERVIVGIIFIGMVITAISFATNRIEKRLLRYQEVNHD
ncbi:MAG: ABC transporter permease [Victivallaceae bacterium]|nr:ABC transporter permease [Victivallaceae bacterium]